MDNKLNIKKAQPQNAKENTPYVKYDYSFELKINNDIICQRYFNINKFNPVSLRSINFKEYFDTICDIIQNDLESKTRVYLYNVCCTFADEEKLKKKQLAGQYKSELYAPLYDEFHKDYVNADVNNITFSFLYKDEVVMTKLWDANVYPQFIRKNIDIVNNQWIQVSPTHRIFFDTCDDDKLKYEHSIKKKIFAGRKDLIPPIISMFREICSMENRDYQYY